MDKLKIGLSKQSLKDLKVSTSAMSGKGHHRTEKRQVWCVPVSQLPPLYHQDDWVGVLCHGGAATKPMEQNYP